MLKKFVLSGFLLLGVVVGVAQECKFQLSGVVLDSESGDPIPYASLGLEELNAGVVTEVDGSFEFVALCAGTYTLSFHYLGWKEFSMAIIIPQDSVLEVWATPGVVKLEEIVVSEKAAPPVEAQAKEVLTGQGLEARQGFNLGTVLEALPGVTTLNTGASISKPVIQGMHSNRVLVLNNGVRQEGQQWGVEHAPEIDPFVADKITVVKGANSVRYGPDAIGGVILVEPKPLPTDIGISGLLNLGGSTNGRAGTAALLLEGSLGTKFPLSGRLQGTLKKGGNLSTPDYYLGNTGVEEYNYSWALGFQREVWKSELFFSTYFTKLGIFEGAHIGNRSDLEDAIERGQPEEDPGFSYELGRPLQRVYHELLKWNTSYSLVDGGSLHFQLSRQFNRRQEFDAHRPFGELPDGFDDPDIEFELTTYTAESYWAHPSFGNFTGQVGISAMHQRNTTDRGGLIPNYESFNSGLFWIERWKNYPFPLEVEAGLRYDFRWQDVGQQGQQTIDQSMQFHNVSGSLGAIYRFGTSGQLKASFGTAWRPPNVNELYSEGVHHGSASYEEGNSELEVEQAYNNSLSLDWADESTWNISLTTYYNYINNYIYLQPKDEPQLTIRGAFPAFEYAQTNARIMGMDGQIHYSFWKNWTLGGSLSIVRGRDLENAVGIVYMPVDRFQYHLQYTFGSKGEEEQPFVRISLAHHLRQTRVPEDTDYLPPPDGYTLLNFDAGAYIPIGKQRMELSLLAQNLLNTPYRSYLNRFRYFANEAGRNITLRLKIPLFNFKSMLGIY